MNHLYPRFKSEPIPIFAEEAAGIPGPEVLAVIILIH